MPKLAVIIACLLGVALPACATEVKSLTHVKASLEEGDGLAPLQFSYLPDDRGMDPVEELEIRFDGQPIVLGSHAPLSVNSNEAMISLWLPPGTGRFEFVRDGATVLTSEPVTLEEGRFNYLIVHGTRAAPDVLELSAELEARRLNIANLRLDREDLTVELLDGADQPLGEPKVLAYGETWSHLPSVDAVSVKFTSGEWDVAVAISCSPKIAMLSFDMPWSDERYESAPGLIGLVAPTEPGSPDAAAEGCYQPTCDCPDRLQ